MLLVEENPTSLVGNRESIYSDIFHRKQGYTPTSLRCHGDRG